jgi:glycine cleavage system aminomethyltransferase T
LLQYHYLIIFVGNDLNEETTPIEASLKWTIGKRRQQTCDFIGGDVIKRQMAEGITKRRVGILSAGAPPRAGAQLVLPDGTEVLIKLAHACGPPDTALHAACVHLRVSVTGIPGHFKPKS